MLNNLPNLPINAILPELQEKLSRHNSIILTADPGSGKTTIVPLILQKNPLFAKQKIVMIEPRRLAARMAAKRMSDLAVEPLGGLVGYRIRFDSKISSSTKIEVVTEGIFLRMIQSDPELSGVGLVLFDEFHERSIQSDLALAFCLDSLELREDLKIIIMSATIAGERIAKLLGNAPTITGKGRCFPVDVQYLSRESNDYLIPQVVRAILRAVKNDSGDILVFLPGSGEIRAVAKKIKGDFLVLPLYGDLPQHQQDAVFSKSGQRRIILATPIAETSLTIEGVSVVIDSGMMKKPVFSPANGLSSLRTLPISKASAKQRSGRAGRLGPGRCYRLWTKATHYSKPDFLPPEIVNADLSSLLLEVLQWGVQDPLELYWLDPPRKGQLSQARLLLEQLGALDNNGTLTNTGKQIAALPLHPRLALMLLQGRKQQQTLLACRLAALLQNRDLFRGRRDEQNTDIEERLEILQLYKQKQTDTIRARGADSTLCRRIAREAAQYQNIMGKSADTGHGPGDAGNLLALAYPERIAKKKADSVKYLLASGKGVTLPAGDHLQRAEFLVAANVDGGDKQGRIYLAAAICLDDIIKHHKHLLAEEERIEWNGQKVEAVKLLSLGKLEIKREPLPTADPEKVMDCFLEGLKRSG
ncbi:MAG: ATP-dependent helicase HrpB, partial [Desulfocapsa sp.]